MNVLKYISNKKNPFTALEWSGFAIFLIIFVLSIILWQVVRIEEKKQISELTMLEKITHEKIVNKYITDRFNALIRMADRWNDDQGTPRELWERDAKRYIEDQSDYRALVWVDSDYHVRWVVPMEASEAGLGLDLTQDSKLYNTLKESHEKNILSFSSVIDIEQGVKSFLVFSPVYTNQKFDGFILGVFNLKEFFYHAFDNEITSLNYFVSIYENENEVLTIGDKSASGEEFSESFEINFTDVSWRAVISPNDHFLSSHTSNLGLLILFSGSLIALLLGYIFRTFFLLRKEQVYVSELESHSSSVLNTVIDGIINISKEGKIILFNPAAENIFGYQAKEVLGKNIKILMPSPYHEEHDGYLHNYLTTGEKKIIGIGREVVGLRKDGTTFPMELSVSEVTVGDDRNFTGIVRDISERKSAEEILRKTFDSAPNALVMIDVDGVIQLVNQALLEMFGYTKDELIGKQIEILLPDKFRGDHHKLRESYIIKPVKRVMGEGRDLYGLKKDGTEFPVEIGLNPIETNDGVMVISSIVDITDRIEQLKTLREKTFELERTSNNLAGVLETAVDAIISIEPDGKIRAFNPAAERMFGYSEEEVTGKNVKMLMPSPYHEEHDGYLHNYLTTGEKKIIGIGREVVGLRKDGTTFPMELSVSEVTVGDDRNFTGIVRDISERKSAEIEIKQRTLDLERSNEELEQFAYVASHDLQEPLRMVSSYTQLLAKRYRDKLDGDALEFIDYAVDGAKRMQTLVQDLLQFSRLSTTDEKSEIIEANALVQYALENLQVAIEETGSVVTSDNLPQLIGIPGQLRQLFQNLIGNSVKYRDPDKQNKIHISADKLGSDWQFCIEDNGIGIGPEFYNKIFVIFQRLHTKQKYQGTGIGLAICKKIVENHQGKIWIESEDGIGSRFYFTLPDIS